MNGRARERRGPDRREVLLTGAAGGLGLLAGGARPPRRTSVLYLLPDQLRRQALPAYGDPVVRTPRLDALAKESLVFDRATSTTPVCSAYRTQMLTGLYTHATGNKLSVGGDTLYRRLDAAGYHVGHIGKWHMTPKDLLRDDDFVPAVIRQGVSYSAMHEVEHRYRNGIWYLNDDETPRSAGDWEPDCQADLARAFLEERRESETPFFLTLALGPPHQPYEPHPRFDTYRPEDVLLRPNVPDDDADRARRRLAGYYGLVSSVDDAVGRVLDALEETGLAASTVVVFTSDHGDMLFGQGEQYKRRPWEEAICVPLFLRFPEAHPLRRTGRSDELVATADLAPTLLALLGLEPAAGGHGRVLLRDDAPAALYLEQDSGANAPFRAPWRGVVTADGWKLATSRARERWLLYHLAEDPYEEHNRIDDPECAGRRGELEGLLRELASGLDDDWFA